MVQEDYCFKIDGKCPHRFSKTKKICFIMMAYDEFYSADIEKMLKEAVKTVLKLNPVLAKEIKHRGSGDMFCTKVCRPIKESTYCIADFTYDNSNVGYETAIAQRFQKPVIITRYLALRAKLSTNESTLLDDIKQKGAIQYSAIPFNVNSSDAQGIFRIDYSNTKELKTQLKNNFAIE